ncbi:MAG: diguanylate cyclase [Gaiellaceae bacterium]|jgi:diguanylate cyclase (GGDEF)-like protein
MSSLAHRLIAYFLLLVMAPFVAGFLGFAAVTERSEQRRLDEGLETSLRSALATFNDELLQAQQNAERLARTPVFQRALVRNDHAILAGFLAGFPNLRLEGVKFRIGKLPIYAGERRVQIVGAKQPLGVLIASVPLDSSDLKQLALLAGIQRGDSLELVRGNRVFSSRVGAAAEATLNRDGIGNVRLGGKNYRIVASRPVTARGSVGLALVTLESRAGNAAFRTEERLFLLLLGFLVLMGTIAFFEGRGIVRRVGGLAAAARAIARGQLSERVPVHGHDEFASLAYAFNEMAGQLEARMRDLERERARLREATVRFGEALGVSDDAVQLLRVVVESAVQATRACGGIVVGPNGERFVAGEPEKGKEQSEWSLKAGREYLGTLILTGDQFGEEELEMVALLCGHAAVALDNARLHRIVEHQALVDGLTGLANRRRTEAALDEEIVRASRLGGELTLVILDIDHFKEVNDRYGHASGDVVLKELALVLNQSLREIDTAGRWGGEEFALVLPGTDTSGGAQLCERIRQTLARRRIPNENGAAISITASFGVASFQPGGSRERLLAAADEALYRAKRAGRNRVETAEGESLETEASE